MFGFPHFYNEALRRYTIVFGTMFNDVEILKVSEDGHTRRRVKVPISYGPKEKFLARLAAEPDLSLDGSPKQMAITLPRMAFEITGVQYDPSRKLNPMAQITGPASDASQEKVVYTPVPYNIGFQLNVLARTYDDGPQILEQILPFFTPEWTNAVNILDGIGKSFDCPLILNGVSNADNYEGDFKNRRAVVWTLDFTMKCYFFGPTKSKKTIRVATTNLFMPPQADANGVMQITYNQSQTDELTGFGNTAAFVNRSTIVAEPGLTANGTPTSNASLSIPVDQISANSDWGYVVTITENNQ